MWPYVHSLHVAKPTEAPLVEDGVHAVHDDAFMDFCVWHFVLPLDTQDTPQASQVEAVGFPLMPLKNCNLVQ